MQRRTLFLILGLILSVSLTGCIFVPFIDSARQSGLLQSDRQRLLQEEVVRFNRVRMWGKQLQALSFAEPDSQATIRQFLVQHGKDERVVESEIESIEFSPDAYAAIVNSRVRYYRVPYYVVEERQENQEWSFSLSGGWKIKDVEVETRG
ncbi:hypothetical protein EBR25_02835 [bacterium]|nr:hypothetical protein [bacterium]